MIKNNNLEIEFASNYFIEVFKIKHFSFGNVTLGYFNAFKSIEFLNPNQKIEVKKWLKEVFESSSIVAGDFNSVPKRISEFLNEVKIPARILSTPSYLFPKEDIKEPLDIPSFDNFVVADDKINESRIEPLIKLPEKLNLNPREYMKQITSPSDHIPIIGHFIKGEEKLSIGIYNVADPVLWGDYYPSSKMGFDITKDGEAKRQKILTNYVTTLIQNCDLILLSEVPTNYLDVLKAIVSNNCNMRIQIEDMVHTEDDQGG